VKFIIKNDFIIKNIRMFCPVLGSIRKVYKNNFQDLYDYIFISHEILPLNVKLCYNFWMYLVKNVKVKIRVALLDNEEYQDYDEVNFNIEKRQLYSYFSEHNPMVASNFISAFKLIPSDFLEKHLNYLYEFDQNYNYKIILEIDFNTPDNIFMLTTPEIPDYKKLEMKVSFFKSNDNIIQKHREIWFKKNNKILFCL